MNKTVFRFLQCVIILGLAIYLGEKWISGKLSYYINLRFAIFTVIGVVGLTIMVVVGLVPLLAKRQRHSPQQLDQADPSQLSDIPGTALLILTIPLLLGVLVPVRPLSASSLSTRGMGLSAPVSIGQNKTSVMQVVADDRTILDWIKIFNYEQDLSPYLGKPANVIGFVYHDPRLNKGQFMVGRFAITCCVADAFAIGMAVDWPDSASLQDNSWVNVKGPVDELTIDGQKVPLIHATTVEPISAPEQPYLYP
jgi:putative membrane protein